MKTRISVLIISILCLSMLFVSCSKGCETHIDENYDGVCDVCEEDVEVGAGAAGCETHTDADADKVCDVCKRAIVAVVEHETAAPSEEEVRVPMVVNPIPDEAAGSFFKEEDGYDFIKTANKINADDIKQEIDYYWYLVSESSDKVKTHKVIDIRDIQNVIWTVNESDGITYKVELSENYFTVTKNEKSGINTVESKQLYTYGKDKIGETWSSTESNSFNAPKISSAEGYIYVSYEDFVYVVSNETNKVVYVFDGTLDTIVDRPEMNYIIGDNGYVVDSVNMKVTVYDLTKWISKKCEYSLPDDYMADGATISVLQNGNILISGVSELPRDAVSYDISMLGVKYDLIYTIIDVETNSKSEDIEFGYLVGSVAPAAESDFADLLSESAEEYNVALVCPITNDSLDYSDVKALLVDNDLNIICDLTDRIENISNNMITVGEGLYVREVHPYTNATLYEVIDEKGEHIRYIAGGSKWIFHYGYREYGEKHYKYTSDDIIIDLDDYNVVSGYGYDGVDFYHLTKRAKGTNELEEYLYIVGKNPVKIEKDDTKKNFAVEYYDFGYVIKYDNDAGKTVSVFYNPEGVKLFEAIGVNGYDGKESGGVYVIEVECADGIIYCICE